MFLLAYSFGAGTLLGLFVAAFAYRAQVAAAVLCALPSVAIAFALELHPTGTLPPDGISPLWALGVVAGAVVGALMVWSYKLTRRLTMRWSGP
jgi:hypothetical protein